MQIVITIELDGAAGEHKHTSRIGVLPADLENEKLWKAVAADDMVEFLRETKRHLTKRAPDARKSALKKVSSNKKCSAKPARG